VWNPTGLTLQTVFEFHTPNSAFRILNGGLPRCCPVLCGLRDRCIAAMLATPESDA